MILFTSLSCTKSTPDQQKIHMEAYENNTLVLIDRFFIPKAAINEFMERMEYNRNLIQQLPGFIKDAAYIQPDENGSIICITVAEWQSKEAIQKAKKAVQEDYARTGFDLKGMIERLGITIERGEFSPLATHTVNYH